MATMKMTMMPEVMMTMGSATIVLTTTVEGDGIFVDQYAIDKTSQMDARVVQAMFHFMQ